jgi:hypothetical protein
VIVIGRNFRNQINGMPLPDHAVIDSESHLRAVMLLLRC